MIATENIYKLTKKTLREQYLYFRSRGPLLNFRRVFIYSFDCPLFMAYDTLRDILASP